MKIIISPTKQMVNENEAFLPKTEPIFIEQAQMILKKLKTLSYDEAKALWKCSDKLAQENHQRIKEANLGQNTAPAIMSYKGLQYQYMAPDILTDSALDYLQDHVRILSGLYGVLKPFDGIVPYRLEMQALLEVDRTQHLYEFWADKLYNELNFDDGPVINLASKEYSKAIQPFLQKKDQFIEVSFAQMINDKLKVKATPAKIARGEMVRYLAENQVKTLDGIKNFDHPDYTYSEEHSTPKKMVFIHQVVL